MPALVKTKTWVKSSTQIDEGDGPTPQTSQSQGHSDRRLMMFIIKTQMLAAGWTVVSSCGYWGAAWHYGALDHWPDAASVRWKEADDKRSWIVLKNTALHNVGDDFQVCFSLDAAAWSSTSLSLLFSVEGGFTIGGNETTRPTAIDEVSLLNNALFFTGPSLSLPYFLNIWYSTDGQCFRIHHDLFTQSGKQLMFERIQDPPSWLDKPVLVAYVNWGRTLLSHISTTAKINFCCDEFSGQVASFATEMDKVGNLLSNATIFQTADADANWSVFPVSIVSLSYLVPGYLGKIADFWFAPTAIPQYNYMPSTGEKEFVVINQVLIGNDGTDVIY